MSVNLSEQFFQCTRESDFPDAQKKYGTNGIHFLFHKICGTIPSDLRSKTQFVGDRVTVPATDIATATFLVQKVNQFTCQSETSFFSGLLPRAYLADKQVVVKFQPCIIESER